MDTKSITRPFTKVAAFFAARLPRVIAQDVTLGNQWYKSNGYYKFKVGQMIDCKSPQHIGYGLNPLGWTVRGCEKEDNSGFDVYVIETAEGDTHTYTKWNIENHFKPADPDAKPFDPHRFEIEKSL